MEIGDLVLYQDQRWMVVSFEREARLMTIVNLSGEKRELPREYDRTHKSQLQVIVNPSKDWPMLTAKVKSPKAGVFIQVVDPAPMGKPLRVLEPWVDWVPSDVGRCGGSFFVNPELKLLPGTLLLATHKNGSVVRVMVPKTMGTVSQRKAQAQVKASVKAPKKTEPNRFSRLLEDEDET